MVSRVLSIIFDRLILLMLIPGKKFHHQRGFFDPIVLGSVISAGAGLAGGLLSKSGAAKRNEAQIASAREQMEFQKMMSDTAHQREVKDLRAAGLNPILSATGGSGASTPGGAQAQIQDELTPAVSTALQSAQIEAALKNVRMETERAASDADLKDEQANVAVHQKEKILLEKENVKAVTRHNEALATAAELVIPGLTVESEIDKEGTGDISRRIKRFTDLIPGLGLLIRGGRGSKKLPPKTQKYNPMFKR